MNNVEGLVILLTYLAVSASAVAGALEARKYEMDIVGATTVAFVTAFGGRCHNKKLVRKRTSFFVMCCICVTYGVGVAVASSVLACAAYITNVAAGLSAE